MSKFTSVTFRLFVTWKFHIVVFLPIFCFQVIFILLMSVLFQVAEISLFCSFLLSPGIFLSRYQRYLQCWRVLFISLTHISLSMSSLGYQTLCIDISFFVLWFVCWSFSRVHFKNGPEHHTWKTAQVFMPLMRHLLYSLVSSSFFFFLLKHFFF